MAAVTICSDFGASKNEVCQMGSDAMILVFQSYKIYHIYFII